MPKASCCPPVIGAHPYHPPRRPRRTRKTQICAWPGGDRGCKDRPSEAGRELPRNLGVLHNPLLRAVAVRYWAQTMRSPMGELCFAAHCRLAEGELRALGQDAAARITGSPALAELLGP
jgi:hypothetical protein